MSAGSFLEKVTRKRWESMQKGVGFLKRVLSSRKAGSAQFCSPSKVELYGKDKKSFFKKLHDLQLTQFVWQ